MTRSFRVTVAGELLETVDITSWDGMLAINLPTGTVATDRDGERLQTLEITVDENPAPPSDDVHVIVGPAYDFASNEATLSRAMTLTWSYDRSALPEGVREQDLVLAYYEGNVGQWIELDCVGDFVSQVIMAKVRHLTVFAILGFKPAPAALTVGELSVFPKMVNIGENVAITVSIANSGDLAGSCNLTLDVNNSAVMGIERVMVPGGARQTVTFTISRETPGVYVVGVNGLMGSFKVREVAVIPAVVAVGLVSYLLLRKRRDARRYQTRSPASDPLRL